MQQFYSILKSREILFVLDAVTKQPTIFLGLSCIVYDNTITTTQSFSSQNSNGKIIYEVPETIAVAIFSVNIANATSIFKRTGKVIFKNLQDC